MHGNSRHPLDQGIEELEKAMKEHSMVATVRWANNSHHLAQETLTKGADLHRALMCLVYLRENETEYSKAVARGVVTETDDVPSPVTA